jgi:hypothetical protein
LGENKTLAAIKRNIIVTLKKFLFRWSNKNYPNSHNLMEITPNVYNHSSSDAASINNE